MIGITGTSGKTSVSYLASSILHEAGYQVGLISSLGVFDGTEYHRVCGHELLPNELAAWLYRMMMNGCTHVVIEASSQWIANGILGGIKFDAVCITNIRKDHLDYHQSVEEYRRCKLDIFKYAKKNALAIFNADDKISEAVTPFIDYPMLTAGIHNTSADINGVLVDRSISEQTFYITAGMETAAVQTPIIGDEHVYNCLTAATLCISFGVDIQSVARGIEEIKTIPGRMERIDCGEDFCVFIDSARTPDSLSSVLRTLREVTPNRLLCVFGAAESKTTKHQAFVKALENYCDCVILTSAADEYNDDTTDAICNLGGQFSDPFKATVISHRSDAISWSLTDAESGDTVLIIGNNVDAGALRVHNEETRTETVSSLMVTGLN
jgi:UDP-N-acetylmuramoyl-L-alanyl-D-glutamate--2,6-diaminopimelate ligase